jgi:hypothetical protein
MAIMGMTWTIVDNYTSSLNIDTVKSQVGSNKTLSPRESSMGNSECQSEASNGFPENTGNMEATHTEVAVVLR